jgi:hypothetical protein
MELVAILQIQQKIGLTSTSNFDLVAILTNPILHPNTRFKPFWQEYFLWEWK